MDHKTLTFKETQKNYQRYFEIEKTFGKQFLKNRRKMKLNQVI